MVPRTVSSLATLKGSEARLSPAGIVLIERGAFAPVTSFVRGIDLAALGIGDAAIANMFLLNEKEPGRR
jgi:hypothetical protein